MKQIISRILNRGNHNGHAGDVRHLTRLVRRYTVEQQQVPRDLLDLVALKYLPAAPEPPAGRRFIIDRRKVEVRLE
jgi:hypothetical protein